MAPRHLPGPLLQRPWHVVGLAGAQVVLVPLPSSPHPWRRHEAVRHVATGVPELLAAPHPRSSPGTRHSIWDPLHPATPIALHAQLHRQPFSSSSHLPRGFVPAVFSAWSDLRVAGSVCRSHLGCVCPLTALMSGTPHVTPGRSLHPQPLARSGMAMPRCLPPRLLQWTL